MKSAQQLFSRVFLTPRGLDDVLALKILCLGCGAENIAYRDPFHVRFENDRVDQRTGVTITRQNSIL